MKSSICSVILLSISSSALAASNGSTLLRGAPAIEGSIKDEVERGSNKEQYLLPVVDAFHDWEEWEDDEKGPSEEKPPLFGANFPETVSPDSRCRTGGQPCNYLGPCCSEFSCEWTRVSMRTKYCVPFTQNESLVEIEPEPEKVHEPIHSAVENLQQDTAFVQEETKCLPYGYGCSSDADCCDGRLCIDIGAGLLYCLSLHSEEIE